MGGKTWMLVLADTNAREALAVKPSLDREATKKLVKTLFPDETLELIGDGDLSYTCPPENELLIGCFQGITVVAAKEFGIDYPSKLPQRFIAAGGSGTVILHAMHSVVDWFAFAVWTNGKLQRSLSLAPDNGIIENVGEYLSFEGPYWSGEYPAVDSDEEEDSYPFPFHPLDLGEATLKTLFGYQLEGYSDSMLLKPESIPLIRYKRTRQPWWKFW
jgi:hypothetical protein